MAISSEAIYLLNKMNKIAQKVGLGTLIQTAETLGSAIGSLTSAYFIVGNGSGVGTGVAMSGDATLSNAGAVTIGAKKITEGKIAIASGKILVGQSGGEALAVTPSGDVTVSTSGVMTVRKTKYAYETFDQPVVCAGTLGGATSIPTGANGALNVIMTGDNVLQYTLTHTGTGTLVAPSWALATGLEIGLDKTNNCGLAITQGITSASRMAMTAGTDKFYMQAKVKIADVSGTDECIVGFRKAEAHQATVAGYDEMAGLNVISGAIKIDTILNNGSDAITDTTSALTDGQYAELRIEHDHTVGLSSAIALATDLRAKYNAHIADATHHTTGADAVNGITAAVPTDLATLITLVTEMLTDYDAHEGDSELASTWLYHEAQEAGNVSLASTAAPTTLPGCIARLNDFKTKFDAHDADTTAHGAAGGHASSVAAASSTTFKVGVNGAAIAAAVATAPFTFDDGEVVVPFLQFLHDATSPGAIYLQHWEVGLLS